MRARILSALAILCICIPCFAEQSYPSFVAKTQGNSMLPTIKPESVVLIVEVPFDQIHEGDIVVYRNIWLHGQSVCHRAVRRGGLFEKGWVCRGDNNRADDMGLCTKKNFVGRVVDIEREVIFNPRKFYANEQRQ